jgi:hypothetical protein
MTPSGQILGKINFRIEKVIVPADLTIKEL